jgi:hypothetical protein
MSGREFTKVSPAVWASVRFKTLSDRGRLLYLYMLTNQHINSSGVYRLPDAYAASDMGWNVDDYHAERAALVGAKMLDYDTDTSEVLIERWYRHNGPMNDKHAIGTRKFIMAIDSDRLRELAEVAFVEADQRRIADQEAKALARQARQAANDQEKTLASVVGPAAARLASTSYMRGKG